MLNFSSLFNKTLVTKDYENFQIKFRTEFQIKYLIKKKRNKCPKSPKIEK